MLHSSGRWLIVCTLGCCGVPVAAQTPAEVNQAISRGVSFLKGKQRPDGGWEDYNDFRGGVTALITLALVSCDEPLDGPAIQDALRLLRGIQPQHTYVVALQTMAFAEASPKTDLLLLRRNTEWLMRSRLRNGRWSYGSRELAGGDNSNTQYALLGLWAAAEAGVDIPDEFWRQTKQYWTFAQNRQTHAWGYTDPGDNSASMTVAGISSLVIANRQLDAVQKGVFKGQPVRCDGIPEDDNLEAAIGWMGRNFAVNRNQGGNNEWLYYYLYGLERAGRLSGRRFFGDHDWYRAGVRYLVQSQDVGGSWSMGGGDNVRRLYNTAFALLFLSKGRIPILVNKARFGRSDDWNNAPNDVHNLTNFMARTWNVKLNWQVVELAVATVEDLLQAPVLAINGHAMPDLGDRDKAGLRKFVEQGGLLMADSNCGVKDFDAGFRRLCNELFPEPGQELHRLDSSHGVWSSLFDLRDVAENFPLYGVDVGCRTGVFYSPNDLSCAWEHHKEAASTTAFRIGANIIAYATGPESLQDKLEVRKVYDNIPEDEIKRNFLQIAKIRHNGDWNPAPRAVANLLNSLRDVAKIDVVRQQRDIDLLDPNLLNYPLAYLHGRTRFTLNRKEKETLVEYIRLGGVVFADSCCGSERFDESFRELMRELFTEAPLEPIPPDHELYTRDIGYAIDKVTFGPALGDRTGAPVLEGVMLEGRYAVIYSKYDLGCALERQLSRDCKGYTHESAIKIATNIVLYALKQ